MLGESLHLDDFGFELDELLEGFYGISVVVCWLFFAKVKLIIGVLFKSRLILDLLLELVIELISLTPEGIVLTGFIWPFKTLLLLLTIVLEGLIGIWVWGGMNCWFIIGWLFNWGENWGGFGIG